MTRFRNTGRFLRNTIGHCASYLLLPVILVAGLIGSLYPGSALAAPAQQEDGRRPAQLDGDPPVMALEAAPGSTSSVYLPLAMGPSLPSTSFELIEAARARGEIDEETAYLYQIYAVFADPRLPARFRGTVTEADAEGAVRQLGKRLPTLSAAGQRALLPFIQPPAYSGSWYEMQYRPNPAAGPAGANGEAAVEPPVGPGWQSAGPPDGKVKVWWNQIDSPNLGTAASLLATFMNDTIWPKETAMMGREPLSDKGPHVVTDKAGQTHALGDGGDARLDVYIVSSQSGMEQLMGTGGAATVGYPPGCKNRPAFMLLSRAILADPVMLESALIHEFSHTIQFAYNYAKECSEYHWIEEATAVWMVDYVSPDLQKEHKRPGLALWPGTSLENHNYDAWAFFFWLARQYSPNVIRFAWSQTEYDDSLASIDAALSGDGGLLKYWPEFALRAWNRAPFDQFWQWDRYDGRADAWIKRLVLGERQSTELDVLDGPLNHLAAHYADVYVADPSIRSVTFWNPFRSQVPRDPAVKVRALVKVEGRDWFQEDWTDLYSRSFCRDVKEDRVERLVIITSNAAWADRSHVVQPASPPHLAATNIGCWRWTGTVTSSLQRVSGSVTDSFSAQVTWERDAGQNPATPGLQNTYHIVAGTLSGTRSGTDSSGCTYSASVSGLPLGRNDGWINVLHTYMYQPVDLGLFYANASATQSGNTYRRSCPGGGTTTGPWSIYPFMNTLDQRFFVSPDGKTLVGDATRGGERYTWDLRALDPQP